MYVNIAVVKMAIKCCQPVNSTLKIQNLQIEDVKIARLDWWRDLVLTYLVLGGYPLEYSTGKSVKEALGEVA